VDKPTTADAIVQLWGATAGLAVWLLPFVRILPVVASISGPVPIELLGAVS
jgi:hypothetical protein